MRIRRHVREPGLRPGREDRSRGASRSDGLDGCLGRPEDNFIVHGAAIERMRMANNGKLARGPLRIPLEQRLEVSCWSGNR